MRSVLAARILLDSNICSSSINAKDFARVPGLQLDHWVQFS